MNVNSFSVKASELDAFVSTDLGGFVHKINCCLAGMHGILFVAALAASSPALAQTVPCGNGNQLPCVTPAPLLAAGIPGLLALGGGYLAVRKRRRDRSKK